MESLALNYDDVSPSIPWGEIILATLLVNLASLIGVMLTVFTVWIPRLRKQWAEKKKQ